MTSPKTSGPSESSPAPPASVEERLAEADAALDRFEHGMGIPAVGEDEVTLESRRWLAMPPSLLKKLSAVECGEGAYVLGQYAHRLQQACNREQGRLTWANESIKRVIAKVINNYKGVSFEERRLQAVRDNDAARALDAARVKAQLRLDRISYLSGKANDMAKTLLSLGNAKRGARE